MEGIENPKKSRQYDLLTLKTLQCIGNCRELWQNASF